MPGLNRNLKENLHHQEIADILEMVPEEVKEALKTNGRTVSMDAPISAEEDNNMYDVIQSADTPSPDRNLINESLAYEIERALKYPFSARIKSSEAIFRIGNETSLYT